MNVTIYDDGTARLTSGSGTVRHLLSGRSYREVRCPVADVDRYGDGEARSVRVESSAVSYSKYRIQLACQKRGVWQQLKEKIALGGYQDSWNNIVELRSDNPELAAMMPVLRAAFGDDLVDQVLGESVA